MKIKVCCILAAGILPNSKIKIHILRKLGWTIERSVTIAPNLFVNVTSAVLKNGALIRGFNIFRNVSLDFGQESIFGSFNWVGAAKDLEILENYSGKLSIGRESAVNSRNYFDVSGGVILGDFSDIAGVRSTFITHQIDLHSSVQTCSPIVIGKHSIICSNSIFVPGGTKVGERCLIAMGSVVTSGNYPNDGFFAGNPARLKKKNVGSWFFREVGPVKPNV
jgi:acetyltransferase-like isoleucine patch superfamily enzyme